MAIAEITAALGGLRAATELAKALADADKAMGVAEFKMKAADLMGQLADARTALVDAQEHTSALQAEVERLEQALEIQGTVVRSGSAYYDAANDGTPKGDPYCMRCWEADHKLFHLSQPDFRNQPSTCPVCKAEYAQGQTYSRS